MLAVNAIICVFCRCSHFWPRHLPLFVGTYKSMLWRCGHSWGLISKYTGYISKSKEVAFILTILLTRFILVLLQSNAHISHLICLL